MLYGDAFVKGQVTSIRSENVFCHLKAETFDNPRFGRRVHGRVVRGGTVLRGPDRSHMHPWEG